MWTATPNIDAYFLINHTEIKLINTELFQTKCAVVLLTGFVSAGFAVPFVSFLAALNFMPSAVK